MNIGLAHLRRDQFGEAITNFTAAIRINHRFTIAYINRGVAYRFQGKLDEAENDFETAIRLDPKTKKLVEEAKSK